jgi:Fibronectin type III domain
LSWSPGGQDPVDSYVLRVRRRNTVPLASDGGEFVDITVSEYTVTDLTAFTAYVAEVFAVNNIGRSLPATVEFTTAEDGK